MSTEFTDTVEYARSIVRLLTDGQLEVETMHWRWEAIPGARTTAFRVACAQERRTRAQRGVSASSSASTCPPVDAIFAAEI